MNEYVKSQERPVEKLGAIGYSVVGVRLGPAGRESRWIASSYRGEDE